MLNIMFWLLISLALLVGLGIIWASIDNNSVMQDLSQEVMTNLHESYADESQNSSNYSLKTVGNNKDSLKRYRTVALSVDNIHACEFEPAYSEVDLSNSPEVEVKRDNNVDNKFAYRFFDLSQNKSLVNAANNKCSEEPKLELYPLKTGEDLQINKHKVA